MEQQHSRPWRAGCLEAPSNPQTLTVLPDAEEVSHSQWGALVVGGSVEAAAIEAAGAGLGAN